MANILPGETAQKYIPAIGHSREERVALADRLVNHGLDRQWADAIVWFDYMPGFGMFARHSLVGRMLKAGVPLEDMHTALLMTGWPDDIDLTREMVRAARPFADKEPVLGYQEKFFVLKEFGGKCRVCWFDADGRFRHQSPAEFKLAEANVKVEIARTKEGVPVTMSAARFWFEHEQRRQYDTARFAPGDPCTLDKGNTINLWRGWRVPLVQGLSDPSGFLGHIFHHLCGGDQVVFNWLLGWLADAVQNVHRTAGTAIVLRGPEGSGKNFFVERVMELFAPHAIMLTKSEQVTGNFNAHLMDKTLVFANEAFFAGSNKDKNALKALVTDGQMMVEPKGVDAFPAEKRFRVIMASNEKWVVNVEGSDRRYLVLQADAGERNNSREYFGDLARRWEEGEREAFFAMLMTRDLSNWSEGDIPETLAKTEQRELSARDETAWVQELLEGGEIPSAGWFKDGSAFLPSAELPCKTRAMGEALRLVGASDMTKKIGGKTRRGWVVPALGFARENFARNTGLRTEWLGHPRADWGHVRGRFGDEPLDLGLPQDEMPF